MEEENKKNTLTKREQGIKMLKEVEDEAFDIYKKVIEDKEYQEYYLLELAQKNEYLKSRIGNALDIINKGLFEEVKKDKKKKLEVILLGIFSIMSSIFLPAQISLIITIIYGIVAYKDIKMRLEKRKDNADLKEMLNIFQKVKDITTNIENNETFIIKKIKDASKQRIETAKTEPVKVNRVLAANLLIQDYLNYDRIPENIDEEVKSTAINMLRQDLNSDETDLEALLKETKKQVSLDTLVKKMEFDEK